MTTVTPSKRLKALQRHSKRFKGSKTFKGVQRASKAGGVQRGEERPGGFEIEGFLRCCTIATGVAELQHFWGVV